MPKAMMLSGGVVHDFPALATEVVGLLAEHHIESEITVEPERALRTLENYDLVVVNMLRWTMDAEPYRKQRAQWGISLGPQARQGLLEFVSGGGALLALHAATICFDDWPEWHALIGGRWVWGTSSHPPFGPFEVTVFPDRHQIVRDLPETFATEDEAYGFLDLAHDVVPLAGATHNGSFHPLVWVREFGAGRVVHDALGHAVSSYRVPAHRSLLAGAIQWLLAAPGGRSNHSLVDRASLGD